MKFLETVLKVLVLVVGLGLLFGGGACLAILVPEALIIGNGASIAPFLLVSLGCAVVGLLLAWAMIANLRRGKQAPAEGAAAGDPWPDGR